MTSSDSLSSFAEHTPWFHEAARVARSALCKRAKCGAVIVADGSVIGEGYNAPPQDDLGQACCEAPVAFVVKPKSDRTCCVHAEWRAICDALRRNAALVPGATLYFTRVDEAGEILRSGPPYCTVCSRLALDVGLSAFALWHEEGIGLYPTDAYNRLSYETLRGGFL
jgi:Cytidine and deoxycytidylate deaminase zinc-binding region